MSKGLFRYDEGFSLPETIAALLIISLLMLPLSNMLGVITKGLGMRSDTQETILTLQNAFESRLQQEQAYFETPNQLSELVPNLELGTKIEIPDDCRYDIVGRRCR